MLLKIKFSSKSSFLLFYFLYIVTKEQIANTYAVYTRTLINHISPFVIPFEPYHILSNSSLLSIKRRHDWQMKNSKKKTFRHTDEFTIPRALSYVDKRSSITFFDVSLNFWDDDSIPSKGRGYKTIALTSSRNVVIE